MADAGIASLQLTPRLAGRYLALSGITPPPPGPDTARAARAAAMPRDRRAGIPPVCPSPASHQQPRPVVDTNVTAQAPATCGHRHEKCHRPRPDVWLACRLFSDVWLAKFLTPRRLMLFAECQNFRKGFTFSSVRTLDVPL